MDEEGNAIIGGPDCGANGDDASACVVNEEDIVKVITLEESGGTRLELDDDNGDIDTDLVPSPSNDMSVCQFTKHSGDVFAISSGINDSIATAISGGEDDRAFEWSIATGEVVRDFGQFSDSVTCIRCNSKRTLVAIGDMNGLIRIYRAKSLDVVAEFQVSDLEWIAWHPGGADILTAGTSDGDIWMWLVVASASPGKGEKNSPSPHCKVMPSPGVSCTTGCFLNDGKRLFAGYADGSLRVWNLKEAIAHTFKHKHNISITAAGCQSKGPLVASGDEDGIVMVTQLDSGKCLATLSCNTTGASRSCSFNAISRGVEDVDIDDAMSDEGSTMTSSSSSVESFAFHATEPWLAGGGMSSDLLLWDLNTFQVRQQCQHPGGSGIVKIHWSPDGTPYSLYSGATDGILRLWDVRNGQVVSEWTGGANAAEILDFDVMGPSSDGAIVSPVVVTAGADHVCRVFKSLV